MRPPHVAANARSHDAWLPLRKLDRATVASWVHSPVAFTEAPSTSMPARVRRSKEGAFVSCWSSSTKTFV